MEFIKTFLAVIINIPLVIVAIILLRCLFIITFGRWNPKMGLWELFKH